MLGGVIGAVCAVLALALWGLFESQWVRCGRRELTVPGLPAALDGFRVLHVSDLHLGAFSLAWLSARQAASWVAGREFDLVVITGDLMSARRGHAHLASFVGSLHSRYGVVAVLGNHDVAVTRDPFSAAAEPVRGELHGIELLRDDAIVLQHDGVSLRVAGIDALTYLRREQDAGALSGPEAFRILLSHYPTIVDRMPNDAFELVLAGHMHGGQICVPWPGGKVRLAHPGAPYPEGTFRVHSGATTLVVSRGLGTTFVPFRFLARPELTELVLRTPTLEA